MDGLTKTIHATNHKYNSGILLLFYKVGYAKSNKRLAILHQYRNIRTSLLQSNKDIDLTKSK